MAEMTLPHGFREAQRELNGLTATAERRVLLWLAARVPAGIGSDHLTALGASAALVAGLLYAASANRPWLLLLVNLALVANWLGDSLDGTLARYRRRTRPRYGFYVDHLLDSLGALFLLSGLALSGHLSRTLAAATLVAYLLLSIEIYLATYTLGRFRIAYGGIGGTELRLLLCGANLVLFARPEARLLGRPLFDALAIGATLGLIVTLVASSLCHGRELYRQEPLGDAPSGTAWSVTEVAPSDGEACL